MKIKVNYDENPSINNTDLKNITDIHFVSNNYLAKSTILNGGYGVFANKDYKKDDIVEVNLYLSLIDNKTGLEKYVHDNHLESESERKKSLLVLGNGSMFNHKDNENVDAYYTLNYNKSNGIYVYYATKDIKKDDEMFVNYGENYEFENGKQ